MPLDQAANLVRERLSDPVDDTTTTLPVTDAAAYPDPANGEYNIVVWDATLHDSAYEDPDAEIMRVTGRDTGADTLTVDRAQEGTAAASHPNGSGVPLPLTAKLVDDIEAELNAVGVNVSDDGTLVVDNTGDINFTASGAAGVSVTDDGDGSASVDVSATDTDTDTRTDVSDDGTPVVTDTDDINFASNLTVTDDGDNSVTVDASGGSSTEIDLLEIPAGDSLPFPGNITKPTIAYYEDEDDYIGVFQQ